MVGIRFVFRGGEQRRVNRVLCKNAWGTQINFSSTHTHLRDGLHWHAKRLKNTHFTHILNKYDRDDPHSSKIEKWNSKILQIAPYHYQKDLHCVLLWGNISELKFGSSSSTIYIVNHNLSELCVNWPFNCKDEFRFEKKTWSSNYILWDWAISPTIEILYWKPDNAMCW